MTLQRLFRHLGAYSLRPPIACGFGIVLPLTNRRIRRLRLAMMQRVFPRQPRWLAALALAYSMLAWHLVGAWVGLWRVRQIQQQSPSRRPASFADLLTLALVYGIHPDGYARLRLHRAARRTWPAFVFPQEHVAFHALYGPSSASPRAKLLDRKTATAAVLQSAGVPTVPTFDALPCGSRPDRDQLFTGPGCFLKPDQGHGMRGCFELRPPSSDSSSPWRLQGRDLQGHPQDRSGEDDIWDCLASEFDRADFIVQPLLRNAAAWSELGFQASDRLITLRLITLRCQEDPPAIELLYAVLEPPLDTTAGGTLCAIDSHTGRLVPPQDSNRTPPGTNLSPCRIPAWETCRAVVARAHEALSDLVLIGWDVAITEQGPVILEGNRAWNTVPPQALSGLPLLEKLAASAPFPCHRGGKRDS